MGVEDEDPDWAPFHVVFIIFLMASSRFMASGSSLTLERAFKHVNRLGFR